MNRANRPRISRVSGSSYASRLLGRAGDGSTLSLDFTTGVLDPRLTFSRGTNATFINSSGLVQYADANYVQNSNDITASGWSVQNGALRSFDTAVVNPLGDLGASLASASSSVGSSAVNTSSFTVNGGLKYTVSFWVRAGTATQLLVGVYDPSIPPSGAFTPATATVISGSATVSAGPAINVSNLTSSWARIRIYLSPTYSGSRAVSFYPDSALASGKSVYLWGVKWEAGHVSDPVQITTGASAYYAPRFDYDPIATGTPRGLLIEGASSNLLTYSESFRTTAVAGEQVWADSASISRGVETGPDGVSNSSVNFVAIGVPGTVIASSAVGTAAVRTLSFWAKRTGGGTVEYTVDNGASWNSQAITATWTRYSFVLASANHRVGFRIATGTGTSIWGVQLEAASVASSYTPTGASSSNRGQELLSITGSAMSWFSSTYTEGTFLFRGSILNTATGYTRLFALTQSASIGTATGSVPSLSVGVAASNSNRPFLNAFVLANNNVDIYAPIGAAVSNGVEFAVAAAYKAADWRISSKSLAATSTYANISTAWGVNLFMSGVNSVSMPAVWYKQFKFFPSRLSDAQMDSLSV